MLERPRLRRHLRVATVAPDKLFISDGSRQSLVEGEVAVALAPLLDGELTAGEILARFSHVPVGAVLATLTRLEQLDYLADGRVNGDAAAAAHWDAARVDPARIPPAGASVEAAGGAAIAPVVAAFERAGLRGAADGLTVVIADDYLEPALEAINLRQLERGAAWVLAKVVGEELWLGPHFRAGAGPCWQCLAQRLAGNRQLDRYLAQRDWRRVGPGVAPALPSTVDTGAALLATEVQAIAAAGGSPR